MSFFGSLFRVDEIFGKQCILLIERKNGNKCVRKISVIWDKKKNKSCSRRLGYEAVLAGNKYIINWRELGMNYSC